MFCRCLALAVVLIGCSKSSAPPPGTEASAATNTKRCKGAECVTRCDAGDLASCHAAARLYFDGANGHPQDMARSYQFAKKGCEGGQVDACTIYGFHYQDGLGAAWDPKRAIEIYDKACAAGAGTSCYNLAGMYLGGHGVTLDRAKGEKLKELAEKHWNASCQSDKVTWCTNAAFLLPMDKSAERLALNKRACDSGDDVGCAQALRNRFDLKQLTADEYVKELLAVCDRGEPSGCGMAAGTLAQTDIAGNRERIDQLSERACKMGDKSSCMIMAINPKSSPQARRKFADDACDRAHGEACMLIAGDLFGAKKYVEGAEYAERACKMGELRGCAGAAGYHLTGVGGAKNMELAIKWATEGCRLSDMRSCQLVLEQGAELPLADEMALPFLESACKVKAPNSCERLAALKKP